MSWVPAEQVFQMVASQRQVLAEQQARIASFAQYHGVERQKLEAQLAQARGELGAALLPSLDPRAIAAAADAVGLAALVQENHPARLATRRHWLVSRISQIEHDPRFAQRELLRHPRTGSIVRALREAEEYRAPFHQVASTCQNHPRFQRLWEGGFGTPEFGTPFWRYSYWGDRSAAAEILAMFPGKTTFADVREEYRVATENLAVYDAEISRLRAELAAGEALAREHDAHVEENQNLEAQWLFGLRDRIVNHVLGSDASLVSRRLARWQPLQMLFLRTSGLASKIAYLDGIQQTTLAQMQAELTTQGLRLQDIERRTQRRWAPMPMDKFQKLAEDRRPRFDKRWQRFGKIYTTVHTYDRWDRGRYYEDLLWWDLMTRGRYDGSFLSEVQVFHRQRPTYRYDPDYKARRQAFLDAQDDDDVLDYADYGDADAASAGIDADTGSSDDGPDLASTDAS